MSSKSGMNLNLKQCNDIINNLYRSKHCKTDYQPEEVLSRKYWLEASRDAKNLATLMIHVGLYSDELPPPLPTECDEGIPENEWLFI